MQLQLKMLQFIPKAPSTFLGQWAMPIRKWFILLSQFCSKAWSNQWIGSRISLNDSFSSLLHALSHLKRLSLVTESLRTSRALFQEECLCLDTINIDIFTIFTLAEIIGYICLHYAEKTEEDPSMCICLVMFRCSVAVMRSFHSSPCQRLYRL